MPVTLTARRLRCRRAYQDLLLLTVEPEGSENLAKDGKVTASLEATAEQLAALFDEDEDTALPVKKLR